jgi:hypothetical protein
LLTIIHKALWFFPLYLKAPPCTGDTFVNGRDRVQLASKPSATQIKKHR